MGKSNKLDAILNTIYFLFHFSGKAGLLRRPVSATVLIKQKEQKEKR
jgi:hypothetical protein